MMSIVFFLGHIYLTPSRTEGILSLNIIEKGLIVRYILILIKLEKGIDLITENRGRVNLDQVLDFL